MKSKNNFIYTCTQEIYTQVVDTQNKETLKAIEKYCEEKGYIPNLIDKDKLEEILILGMTSQENEQNFRNTLIINSPTSVSIGNITYYDLDTKLVGKINKLLKDKDNLQSKINDAIFVYETRNTVEGKKLRFYQGKDVKDLMYEVLKEE